MNNTESIFQCTNCWLLVTHGFSLLPMIRQTKNGLFMISIVMEGDWFMGPDSTIRICWTRGTNIIYLTNVAHIAMKWLAVIEPGVHIFIARLVVDSMVILYHSWTCEASIYRFSWTFAIWIWLTIITTIIRFLIVCIIVRWGYSTFSFWWDRLRGRFILGLEIHILAMRMRKTKFVGSKIVFILKLI